MSTQYQKQKLKWKEQGKKEALEEAYKLGFIVLEEVKRKEEILEILNKRCVHCMIAEELKEKLK
jgi:hypothetical protein